MKMKLLVSVLAATMAMGANAVETPTDIGSQDFIWTGVVPVLGEEGNGDGDKGDFVIVPTIAGIDFEDGRLSFTNNNGVIKLDQASKIGFKVQEKSTVDGKETLTDVAYRYTLQKNFFSATAVSEDGTSNAEEIIDDGYFEIKAAASAGDLQNADPLKVGTQSATVAAGDETLLTVAQSEETDLDVILNAGDVVKVKSTLLITAQNV